MNIFLLAVICVAAARPNTKPAIDGVDDIMYEIPEYVNPELAMFQLSAMNALPLLTFLEMGGEPEDQDDTPSDEQIDDVKTRLEDVISRLDMARSKLEQGDKHIFVDIDKSIYNLKNLQRHFQRETFPMRVSLRKSVALIDKDDLITEKEESLATTQPIISSDDMITVYPLPETKLEISDNGESIPCMQNPNCTDKPQPEKASPSGIMLKIPLDNPTLTTETKKYEDSGKAIFRKKWTWKSSSIV